MSQIRKHQIGEHVYVRDVQYEWLPAIVEDVKEHEVLVRIDLPDDWQKTTIQHDTANTNVDSNDDADEKISDDNHSEGVDIVNGEQRWEKIAEYFNHHLPMQNWNDDDDDQTAKRCHDMSQLQHINESELLYQIKKRYCSYDQPYTRITTAPCNSNTPETTTMMMVAVNPCRYIPSLYTIQKQQHYINLYMNQQKLPLESITRTGDADDIQAPSFDEKKEEDPIDVASNECTFVPDNITMISDRVNCEPHIYEVSSLAYHGLISTPHNQAILVSGESGSGKTESIKIVLKHLASLIPPSTMTKITPSRQQYIRSLTDDALVSHILASSPIFESFGNAKTLCNSNSSRFGKVTKLHYVVSSSTSQGGPVTTASDPITSSIGGACLMGSSFQAYMLEANRVVSHIEGERNYHIFYQMLSAPSPVKNELLGPDWREATPADFRYLNRSSCGIKASMIDASNWTYTLKALIVFGWDGDSLERLIRALGIILLIGNIEFQEIDEKKASITQPADLIILATSLGIDAAELELALTQRTIQTKQDLLLVPFTPEQAIEACEALSKTIYTRIFESIVTQINLLTSSPPSCIVGTTKTIALVDIFGFETFDINRFEQFCINYANERLQQKYVLDSLSCHKTEYEKEGITVPEWENIDNSSTVELFENVPGLIQSLNDQCILPNGSSEDFVSIVRQLHESHVNFKSNKLQTSKAFGVYHFAGPVVYDASKFVERNTDKLPDFLISVVATSTNKLIAQALGEMMKERSSAIRSMKKAQKRSVIDVFQYQLKELLFSIEESQPRYIRCIKPCDNLEVLKKMDHRVVLRQLKCSGLVTAVEQSRNVFPDKLSFETIATRYSCLLSSNAMTSIEDMDLVDKAQVILSSVYAPIIEQYNGSIFAMPFACGHTKVFFRAGALRVLEKQRYLLHSRSAIVVQSVLRSYLVRRRTIRSINAFTLLQAAYRGRVIVCQFKLNKKAIVKVQARGRLIIYRIKFLKMKASIMLLQKWWSRAKVEIETRRKVFNLEKVSALKIYKCLWAQILHRKQQKQKNSILRITAWLRSRKQRLLFVRFKYSTMIVAAWYRAIRTRKHFYEYKKAANTIARYRRFQRELRMARLKQLEESEIRRSLSQQNLAIRKLQSFFRSKLSGAAVGADQFSCTRGYETDGNGVPLNTNCKIVNQSNHSLSADTEECLLSTSQSIFEQVEIYRRQIADLKSDITLLTSEAELHKQEVEAEFEDRLAEYEMEVLQLKQTVENLLNEKLTLKDEIAANTENIQNLKKGIQSMHEGHREYLNKVMRAVENANREHQIALELVQRDKEMQIKELSDEVDRLQIEHRSHPHRNTDNRICHDQIYQLARKIEKITSPDYVVALAKKVRKVTSKEDYVEEKFSGRIRQMLYNLEDTVAQKTSNSTCEEEYILTLQQQLVAAKAEIERLTVKEHINSAGNEPSVGRIGLKKFFER